LSGIEGNVRSVFTIGHSTHEAAHFVALLRRHAVELVVDVRRYPGSRRLPHWGASELAALLEAEGIDFVHLEGLGGRRRPAPESGNVGWRVDQFRGYADHMGSAEFEAAIGRLEALARERSSAMMCAEANWWRCHRQMVADALVIRGLEVRHIDGRGRTRAHELTPFAVVEGGRLRYPPAQAALDV
jgi:uncharacterized protein (DUF488 family)